MNEGYDLYCGREVGCNAGGKFPCVRWKVGEPTMPILCIDGADLPWCVTYVNSGSTAEFAEVELPCVAPETQIV